MAVIPTQAALNLREELVMYPLLAMFGQPMEMIIIALIALLLFGNRLPGVMRSLGRGVVEFKKGVAGIDDETDGAGKKDEQATKP
jgi:sec-independent protein translocase protein TatA